MFPLYSNVTLRGPLQRYKCHINVEICETVHAVKYIHKYIHKGTDRSTLAVETDELKYHLQTRYCGPSEGMWRIFEFPTHGQFPSVVHLPVHLKNEHSIAYMEGESPEELARRKERYRTQLMAWFDYNREHNDLRHVLYKDFPEHCKWDDRNHRWVKRVTNTVELQSSCRRKILLAALIYPRSRCYVL